MDGVTQISISPNLSPKDQDIDEQLVAVLNLIKNGQITKARAKCQALKGTYKNNEAALKKINTFIDKFKLPNLRSISYRLGFSKDNKDNSDLSHEISCNYPAGANNNLRLSIKSFSKDQLAGTAGYSLHKGNMLDAVEYEFGAQISASSADPKKSPLDPVPLFQLSGSYRYRVFYSKGYFGQNSGIGSYGDIQSGFAYNTFNFGAGFARFPYFSPSGDQLENCDGFYAEAGKYSQVGNNIGIFTLIKIPIDGLKAGHLPVYAGFDMNAKTTKNLTLNLQGGYLYGDDYKSMKIGLGASVNF